MVKKIAVINDLSGFGRCSLTAAISVLSTMGVQACPLPTAVLTAQTGYPSYYCDDYTDKMERFRQEWSKMNVQFNGIYTGYVSGEAQIHKIFTFLDTFYKPGHNFLLVDPVMGDHGKTYGMYSDQLRARMRELVLRADLTTPNLTELCLLTDTDFYTLPGADESSSLFAVIEEMCHKLCKQGTKAVAVTGIRYLNTADGSPRIGNLCIAEGVRHLASFPDLGGSYSGTGDLFASVLTGGKARGDNLTDTVQLAGEFLKRALEDSVKENVPFNDGVNYEKYLSLLLPSAYQIRQEDCR